jgi:hypothetical protein
MEGSTAFIAVTKARAEVQKSAGLYPGKVAS